MTIAFRTFITAWTSQINSAPGRVFEPILVENDLPRAVYQVALTLLIGLLGMGLYRVLALRRRRTIVRGQGALAVLGAGIVVLILMVQLPYRILWRADFERVDLGTLQCYNIGASDDSMLV